MLNRDINTKTMRPIENLVFEGGGVRGVCHVGVFAALEQYGIIKNLKRVAGSSIGSLVALAVALSLTAKQMEDLTLSLDLTRLIDFLHHDPARYYKNYHSDDLLSLYGKGIYNVFTYLSQAKESISESVQHRGIHHGDFIEEIASRIISLKLNVKSDLTFGELHKLREQDKSFKDLYVTGSNYTDGKVDIFSYETTPDMLISKAIRISMAAPVMFHSKQHNGKTYIDGGFYCNYPIRIFDDSKYLEDGKLTASGHNMRTLGVILSSDRRTKKLRDNIVSTKGILNRIKSVILSPLLKQDEQHRASHDPLRTIYLDTKNVGVFNFYLSVSKMRAMIEKAKGGAIDYIQNYIVDAKDPNANDYEYMKKLQVLLNFYRLIAQHESKQKLSQDVFHLFKSQLSHSKSCASEDKVNPPKITL